MTDASLAAFGSELERRRSLVRPKLSANEAARRVGMTGQWWRAIERGNGGTTRASIVRMAMVVHWDPDDALLVAGFDDPASDEERRTPAPDPRARIDQSWPMLTDGWREELARIAALAADPHAPVSGRSSDRPVSRAELVDSGMEVVSRPEDAPVEPSAEERARESSQNG